MKREEYQMVKEIFHSALDVAVVERPRFLDEKCSGNANLRREVERLLESYDSGYLEQPAIGKMAKLIVGNELTAGQVVGHHRIIKKIGAGGMGEVYLAEDTKLDRKAAIKFMDEKYVEDINNLKRFFFEAKSSSALNHPNIITVYEIGEYENRPFIVTEFIDGVTLKEHLFEKKPPLVKILDIAIQIASALSAAHKEGIIHRDIKPENVMIRQDGIVKVLDFGLAKYDSTAIDAEVNTLNKISTVRGLIMGTPHFMSPEQARGKTVDTRTDIWSFGVLFYQMLTGNLPFQGDTTPDIIASILKSEPQPLTHFVPDISPVLENIILRVFRKDRNERPQKIDEILTELEIHKRKLDLADETVPINYQSSDRFDFDKETDASFIHTTAKAPLNDTNKQYSVFSQTISKARAFPVFSSFIFVTVVSLLVIFGIGFLRSDLFGDKSASFQNMRFTKLTFTGNVIGGEIMISPDGKYIGYAVDENGQESLWVKQTATSGTVQIVPPAEVEISGLTFSPDNDYIYYTIDDRKGSSAIYKIPALGGTARKIITDARQSVSFSPDGNQIVFSRGGTSLIIANSDGSGAKTLVAVAEGKFWNFPRWSPDGKSIVVIGMSKSDPNQHLVEISVSDGTEKMLAAPPWLTSSGLVWLTDGSGLILSGRDLETQLSQLWFISYPDGAARRITNDLNNYQGLSLTADGKTLVSVQENQLLNIWTVSATNPNLTDRITSEVDKNEGKSGLSWTPDGRIVYTTRIKARLNLWIVNEDGSQNQQLTFDAKSDFLPAVSPDGRYIVFISDRSGNSDLWRMDLDGTNAVQLTDDPNFDSNPAFSPDGKWVFFDHADANNTMNVWKINIDGGRPVRLTDIFSGGAVVSPDGKYFACQYGEAETGSSYKIAIIPIDGGSPTKLLDLPLVIKSVKFTWSSDEQGLVYVNSRDRVSNLWFQALDGSPPKQLTDFKSDQIFNFDMSRSGRGFALSRGNINSDVVLINNFR